MTDKKISELTNITGANLADVDEFVVVDTSANETKAITYAELKKFTGDLTVSGGVYIGGTTSANYLDDYEEGTWTPDFQDQSGNSASITTGTNRYTKIGRQVTIQGEIRDIDTTGLVGTDQVRIYGLPFTNVASTPTDRYICSPRINNITISGSYVIMNLSGGTTFLLLQDVNSAAGNTSVTPNDMTSGVSDIEFTLTYFVD